MKRKQCEKCGRKSYSDGVCYADRKKGRDIKEIVYCAWATPPKSLSLKKKKNMKPIEKYQQKFIELLIEAEEELGGDLAVKVKSFTPVITSEFTVACINAKQYKCSISTANDFLL